MQINYEELPEDIQRKVLEAVGLSQEITITRCGSGGSRNLAVITPWPMRSRRTVSGYGGQGSQWTRHFESSGDPAAALDEP